MYFKKLQAAQEAINYVLAIQSIDSTSALSQGGRNKNYYIVIKTLMKRSGRESAFKRVKKMFAQLPSVW